MEEARLVDVVKVVVVSASGVVLDLLLVTLGSGVVLSASAAFGQDWKEEDGKHKMVAFSRR